jgi:hypothetical protein
MNLCIGKGLNFDPTNGFSITDNAPANKVLSVEQFLAQKLIAEMKHSSYCPDLTVVDLWLFPKMKTALKGQRFQDIEELS